MWITKKENSKGTRYVYRERFICPNTGENITVSVTLNSNNRHAQKTAIQMLQEKFESKQKKATSRKEAILETLTFHDVADEWESYTNPMVKAETVVTHANYVRRMKLAVSASLLFIDFTPTMAEKIVYDMYYVENLSYTYCSSTFTYLKSILRYAQQKGYFRLAQKEYDYPYTLNDFTGIKLIRKPYTKEELAAKQNKFLDERELKDCLKQLKKINCPVSLAMEFIALTGLRCGELLALRVRDYDKDSATININGTLNKNKLNGDPTQRNTPKTPYSYRNVTLNTRAVEIIEWFILENKRHKWVNRLYKNVEGYIFTTKNGNPYNIQYINTQLRKVHIDDKKLSTHIFRHTHISMLAERGVPIKAIMQRVGHNDPTTTMNIYTHVTNKMNDEMKQVLNSIII